MMVDEIECDRPAIYQIRVKGVLDEQWSDWFDGLRISQQPNGEARLAGPVVDQAALYGLLNKLRDLGLPLLSVKRIEVEAQESKDER